MKFLLDLSLTSGKPDPQKIAFIATTLERNELAVYVSLLEKKLQKDKVIVTSAISVPQIFARSLKKLFPEKEVLFKRDPQILAGMQVSFADYVFDASFRHYLEQIRDQYSQNV